MRISVLWRDWKLKLESNAGWYCDEQSLSLQSSLQLVISEWVTTLVLSQQLVISISLQCVIGVGIIVVACAYAVLVNTVIISTLYTIKDNQERSISVL